MSVGLEALFWLVGVYGQSLRQRQSLRYALYRDFEGHEPEQRSRALRPWPGTQDGEKDWRAGIWRGRDYVVWTKEFCPCLTLARAAKRALRSSNPEM